MGPRRVAWAQEGLLGPNKGCLGPSRVAWAQQGLLGPAPPAWSLSTSTFDAVTSVNFNFRCGDEQWYPVTCLSFQPPLSSAHYACIHIHDGEYACTQQTADTDAETRNRTQVRGTHTFEHLSRRSSRLDARHPRIHATPDMHASMRRKTLTLTCTRNAMQLHLSSARYARLSTSGRLDFSQKRPMPRFLGSLSCRAAPKRLSSAFTSRNNTSSPSSLSANARISCVCVCVCMCVFRVPISSDTLRTLTVLSLSLSLSLSLPPSLSVHLAKQR